MDSVPLREEREKENTHEHTYFEVYYRTHTHTHTYIHTGGKMISMTHDHRPRFQNYIYDENDEMQ